MDHNLELVKEVYHDAELCKDVLNTLIKITDDANFRTSLADEYAQYHEIMCSADSVCCEYGYPVKTDKSCKKKIFSGIAISAKIDKTPSHLAEMVIQGSTMGIIDIKRAIREYQCADEKVKRLASKLLETEINNVYKMLEYV